VQSKSEDQDLVARLNSGGTVTFKYDPLGRRILKVFTQGSTTTTTNYVYDGNNSAEEVDQNGNLLARYTEAQNIDEPLAESRSGTTSYYEADGLGSVSSLSSTAGALANNYTYDSFGKLTASTGSLTNSLRYTGREFDVEIGLYFYRARYYDPSVGKFLNEDPIRFLGGMNLYRFTSNDPANMIDPTGFCPCGGGPSAQSKYWTGWGDPNNPFWGRVKMFGAGLGNIALGSAKVVGAATLTAGTGGLATGLGILGAVSSAGNFAAGGMQLAGAFLPNPCEVNEAAKVAAAATSIAGLITLARTGGNVDKAASAAAWEGIFTVPFGVGATGEAANFRDAYDVGTSAKDVVGGEASKCGCH
jgi:RHS repeat-associated protein